MTSDGAPDPGGMRRRDFLKLAGAGAGIALTGACVPDAPRRIADDAFWPGPDSPAPRAGGGDLHVAVIGAGSWGSWTALHLRQMGARVTLVDTYGPGNSRSTSGGETRGVRTSYGDRPHGLHWSRWATESIRRWKRWDEEWGELFLPGVFFTTGDLILRPEWDNYLEQTKTQWDELGVEYEVLDPDEVARRWSIFDLSEAGTALYEPQAGVVRARRAVEGVAEVFEKKGGELIIGRATPGRPEGGRMRRITLTPGDAVEADVFVFALGPWFPKVFPELMGNRLRIPIGHTVYFGPPPGDSRWRFPNAPSWGVPGCTGWASLPPDHRGFRVRTGGQRAEDPDESMRFFGPEGLERPMEIVSQWFPGLVGAPVLETRACHYELTTSRNFIVDHHPDFENVWLAGGGSAESFKFGPWVGDYVARRVLGHETDPVADEGFRLSEEEFLAQPPPREGDEPTAEQATALYWEQYGTPDPVAEEEAEVG